jgi:hypothetical protein
MVASIPRSAPPSPPASSLVVVPGLHRARHMCDAVVASCKFTSLAVVHSRMGGGAGGRGAIGGGSVESTESTEAARPTLKSRRKRDVAAVPPRRRRVRFDYDGDAHDGVKSTVHVYEKVAEEERGLCWTTRQDTYQMKENVRSEAREFMLLNPEYLDGLEQLFQSPLVRLRPATPARNDPILKKAFDRTLFVFTEMSREDAPRGLEYRMSYLIHRHKELTTEAVLRRQEQLRGEAASHGPPKSSSSTLDEALAACCRTLSSCSRDLAIEYGTADAVQAQFAYGGDGDGGVFLCLL